MSAAKKRKSATREPLPAVAEVARALGDQVRREGAIAKTAVTKAARSGRRSLEVFDALASSGLEIGARFVRLPLEDQVEAAVHERGPLALRILSSHVRGATPREARDAALALVQRQRLQLAAQSRDLLVVTSESDVLDVSDLEKLTTAIRELTLSIRTARMKRASILKSDVDVLVRACRTRSGGTSMTGSPFDVEAQVARHREASGLTSVPTLVRALGGATARDAVHAELLRAARAGRLELRPESGLGRLTSEELALCIPGPQGTHLSWVRQIEDSQ